jgi:hypothetical protein
MAVPLERLLNMAMQIPCQVSYKRYASMSYAVVGGPRLVRIRGRVKFSDSPRRRLCDAIDKSPALRDISGVSKSSPLP